jgi:hypothetical protein
MIYPTMVYRHPGRHKIHRDMFDYKIVDAKTEELDKALSDDWYLTTPEALEGVPDDDEMPTRKELKLKAKELGLSFPSNIGSDKLLALIEEALADQ